MISDIISSMFSKSKLFFTFFIFFLILSPSLYAFRALNLIFSIILHFLFNNNLLILALLFAICNKKGSVYLSINTPFG